MRISEAEIRRMLEDMNLSSAHTVSAEAYQARLAVCKSCDALQFGTTCRHCGCLVALRAWLADKPCPDPGGSRW